MAGSRDEITVGTFFYIHHRAISTGIGQVVGIAGSSFGRSILEHLVVSGKFINNLKKRQLTVFLIKKEMDLVVLQ